MHCINTRVSFLAGAIAKAETIKFVQTNRFWNYKPLAVAKQKLQNDRVYYNHDCTFQEQSVQQDAIIAFTTLCPRIAIS